jgi:hypothetical protein
MEWKSRTRSGCPTVNERRGSHMRVRTERAVRRRRTHFLVCLQEMRQGR